MLFSALFLYPEDSPASYTNLVYYTLNHRLLKAGFVCALSLSRSLCPDSLAGSGHGTIRKIGGGAWLQLVILN